MKKKYAQPAIQVMDCETKASVLLTSDLKSGGVDDGSGTAEANRFFDFEDGPGSIWD